ncbi:Phage tail protein (Tail_P2_I) [Pseudomonas sp. URMO17WK12:I11]|nr:Phage tail protein (Tail_P2_I) [Pseudomonas sp. URMO17WK12:I11]
MNSLLPSNSTPLERALEAAFYERTIVPLRSLYNPDTCPVHLLPVMRDIEVTGRFAVIGREHSIDTLDVYHD